MENNEPKINSISIGESILNNVFSLSLFISIRVSKEEENIVTFKILCFGLLIFKLSIIFFIYIGI